VRDLEVSLLCPFDLDFEPDIERFAREDVSVARVQPGPAGVSAIEVPRTLAGALALGGEVLATAVGVTARVYRFGTGIVRITFARESWDLAALAVLSARAEELTVDGKPIVEVARDLAMAIRKRLAPYAFTTIETLLEAVEVYPIVHVGALPEGLVGEDYVAAHRRPLVAIVGGDARTGRLSAFALEEYPVTNLGAIREDVVVIRESGAFVHVAAAQRGRTGAADAVADARRIEGLLELAYAQYWSLRSVDHLIQHLQDQAYVFISSFLHKGPRAPMGEVVRLLYRAREEHMAVSNIVDDFLEMPALGYDAYLDALLRKSQAIFAVPERSRLASDRLEDLERSYEIVHEMINERRLMTLEILVLIVIVIELLVAIAEFMRH
jgi:hypothetical protein